MKPNKAVSFRLWGKIVLGIGLLLLLLSILLNKRDPPFPNCSVVSPIKETKAILQLEATQIQTIEQFIAQAIIDEQKDEGAFRGQVFVAHIASEHGQPVRAWEYSDGKLVAESPEILQQHERDRQVTFFRFTFLSITSNRACAMIWIAFHDANDKRHGGFFWNRIWELARDQDEWRVVAKSP